MTQNNAERLRVLVKSKLLDSAPEEAFDRFTQLAAMLLDIPISLVTLIDKDRQYFKSYYGLPEPWASRQQTPLSHSLCQYVVARQQPLIVKDTRKVALLKKSLAIPELGMVAYLGFPLRVEDQIVGSFCAVDTKPHSWSEREIKIMQELANFVETEILLRMEMLERKKIIIRKLADFIDMELVSRMEALERQKGTEQFSENEERFHTLANQAPVIIWQADKRGGSTFLNTTWFTLTGLTAQESLGNGWISAIHPDERTEILSLWKKSSGVSRTSYTEMRVRRADGVYREMVGQGSPYTNRQGKLQGYIGILLDITENKELASRWETFLGIAAHELKAPLTTIQGNTQLAQRRLKRVVSDIDGLSSEDLQANLSQVMQLLTRNLESLQIQTRLINELQDVSRVQSTHLEFHIAPCDLVEITRQVVFDQQVAYPQQMILFDAPHTPPILVSADEQRVRQVLTNYLTNAFKYSSPEQPVQVGITFTTTAARVWVRDHGAGISPEQQKLIWERFYQVQDTHAHTGLPGLGLGLHICKALIQGQHGNVGVESVQGEGSTFWFTLPLLRV